MEKFNSIMFGNKTIVFLFLKGSRDNMSLIIVSFPGAPKVDQNEIERENNCNERIESRVKGSV